MQETKFEEMRRKESDTISFPLDSAPINPTEETTPNGPSEEIITHKDVVEGENDNNFNETLPRSKRAIQAPLRFRD